MQPDASTLSTVQWAVQGVTVWAFPTLRQHILSLIVWHPLQWKMLVTKMMCRPEWKGRMQTFGGLCFHCGFGRRYKGENLSWWHFNVLHKVASSGVTELKTIAEILEPVQNKHKQTIPILHQIFSLYARNLCSEHNNVPLVLQETVLDQIDLISPKKKKNIIASDISKLLLSTTTKRHCIKKAWSHVTLTHGKSSQHTWAFRECLPYTWRHPVKNFDISMRQVGINDFLQWW